MDNQRAVFAGLAAIAFFKVESSGGFRINKLASTTKLFDDNFTLRRGRARSHRKEETDYASVDSTLD